MFVPAPEVCWAKCLVVLLEAIFAQLNTTHNKLLGHSVALYSAALHVDVVDMMLMVMVVMAIVVMVVLVAIVLRW